MLSSEIVPIMELLTSMKKHSVPEEVDVGISTFGGLRLATFNSQCSIYGKLLVREYLMLLNKCDNGICHNMWVILMKS